VPPLYSHEGFTPKTPGSHESGVTVNEKVDFNDNTDDVSMMMMMMIKLNIKFYHVLYKRQ
jgi:hypothetical protein